MSGQHAPTETRPHPPTTRLSGRTLGGIAAVALLVVWIAVNRERVEISFLLASATLPLWIALAVAGGLGLLAGFLLGRRRYRR